MRPHLRNEVLLAHAVQFEVEPNRVEYRHRYGVARLREINRLQLIFGRSVNRAGFLPIISRFLKRANAAAGAGTLSFAHIVGAFGSLPFCSIPFLMRMFCSLPFYGTLARSSRRV